MRRHGHHEARAALGAALFPLTLTACEVGQGALAPVPGFGGSATVFEGPERVGTAHQHVERGAHDPDDPAVVGVLFGEPGGTTQKLCSGSLIAPNLVLTAQHCVASTGKYVNCDTTTFGAAVDPGDLKVTPSDAMFSATATFWPGRELLLPSGGPVVCGRDLALLVLVDPLPDERASPIDPRLDDVVIEGEEFSAVGFGNSGDGAGDAGTRRRRDGLVVQCVGAGCGSSGGVDGREWRANMGACSGDSGGPALDAQGRVIGVTSRGPFGCDSPVYGGLVAWKTWVREAGAYAAKVGGYPAPAWVEGATGDSISAIRSRRGDDTWASCATHPTDARTPHGETVFVALAMAASMLRARRRPHRATSDAVRASSSAPPRPPCAQPPDRPAARGGADRARAP